MSELIKITNRKVSGVEERTINARDLHAFLESRKDFSTWMKDRKAQYGFVEGIDFTTSEDLSSPISGSAKARVQRTISYHLSIGMAKELAMVERNEKGKQARQYFIECERTLTNQLTPQIVMQSDPALAVILAELTRMSSGQQSRLVDFERNLSSVSDSAKVMEATLREVAGRETIFEECPMTHASKSKMREHVAPRYGVSEETVERVIEHAIDLGRSLGSISVRNGHEDAKHSVYLAYKKRLVLNVMDEFVAGCKRLTDQTAQHPWFSRPFRFRPLVKQEA